MADNATTKERGPAFHELPSSMKAQAFGMTYAVLHMPDGGILYITQYGWPWRANILPDMWYTDNKYYKEGELLTGGTGHVYHITTQSPATDNIPKEFVIKINRYAQYVPIDVPDFFYDKVSIEEAKNAHFMHPFEEFGMLEELRIGIFDNQQSRILTKRPIAIYQSPEDVPLWKSGRKKSDFARERRRLMQNQQDVEDYEHVDIDIKKDYITVFEYVKGHDAEYYHQQGLLSAKDLQSLTRRAGREMARKGFRMLDIKPKHFILRETEPGKLMTRNGELVYALIDFELLIRTQEYKRFLQSNYDYHI